MPCTYYETPQEIAASKKAAAERMAAKDKKVKDKLDNLTAELCEARKYIVFLTSGLIKPEEFAESKEFKKILNAHREHREQDRAHAIEERLDKLAKCKNDTERNHLLKEISVISSVVGDQIFTTRLF